MHLATAAGTYTFALFGANDPAKLIPPTSKTVAIKSRSGKISDISPAEILDKVWQS
jgi:ADP-heptose:LPS heptosyltransferase